MNYREISRLRPLMTSFSMSQRTALDALTQRAYLLSRLGTMAFMTVLLHLVRGASNVALAPLGGRTIRSVWAWHKRHITIKSRHRPRVRTSAEQFGGGPAAQLRRMRGCFVNPIGANAISMINRVDSQHALERA